MGHGCPHCYCYYNRGIINMSKHQEKILCIQNEKLFSIGKWNGFQTKDLDKYLDILRNESEFKVREELEENFSYKQIIAQVILRYNDKYFLHKQVNRSETRLNSFSVLPLGGHIEEFDMHKKEDIFETALKRELSEEVDMFSNIIKKSFLGLIYLEDENPVNLVHIGLVYVYDLDGSEVIIKEEGLENIGFVSLDYLKTNKETLNYWSRVIIYHL
jgi:predicted NUDIX family phosphoesterase